MLILTPLYEYALLRKILQVFNAAKNWQSSLKLSHSKTFLIRYSFCTLVLSVDLYRHYEFLGKYVKYHFLQICIKVGHFSCALHCKFHY